MERYKDRSVFRDKMLHPLAMALNKFTAFYLRSEQVIESSWNKEPKEKTEVSGLEFEV